MDKKGIFKILANGKERIMHYTTEDEKIRALSLNDTDLIHDIEDDETVMVTFGMKGTEQVPATITIDKNIDSVKSLFNKMLEEKNTYFKELNDNLIVLEINLK
ncbi:hypothetical protein [Haloplasma contractile]|uniref:Uncharacterized protein n=1 Tax=Haloplasma contractile SSD-17B TaxID=1033810 RepID=U2EEK4_9MOLU|nr:hypothetical protein [Haloplasma contractile]ERJ13126.1 hypothetical protein HLPCO_000745 [Haloplasma contractile SSD-17B]